MAAAEDSILLGLMSRMQSVVTALPAGCNRAMVMQRKWAVACFEQKFRLFCGIGEQVG